MHKIIYFFQKIFFRKICVPTLPKIFRPVTRNTLIILFGPILLLSSMMLMGDPNTLNVREKAELRRRSLMLMFYFLRSPFLFLSSMMLMGDPNTLNVREKAELRRRSLMLMFYFLRSPFYDQYSK